MGNPNYYNIYSGWQYTDANHVVHSFNGVTSDADSTPCSGPPATYSGTAADGSGLTLQEGSASGVLYIANGDSLNQPVTGNVPFMDPNGNQITASQAGSTTTFTDTLGTTALTVYAPAPPSSATYTYTWPSGSPEVTVRYTSFNIQTNFGCLGIGEYNASNVPLVTEIDLPDTTNYTVTYEQTYNNSGYYTGRIASVKLPTGGTISYSYGAGGVNGITCADGSTSGLTRVVNDNNGNVSTWTYARPSAGVTTLTDPQNNVTTFNFQGIYETQRSNSLGSSTTCYNGNTTSCDTTAITLPITERLVTSTLGSVTSKVDMFYNTYGLPTETDEYDFGGTTPIRKTIVSYNYNTSCGVTNANVVNRACTVQVKDGGSVVRAETDKNYDANGNLLTETHSTGGTPSTISRSFTYTSNGVLATATDFNSHTSTFSNTSCNNAFPTGIAPPVIPATALVWDCTGAVVTKVTDANLQPTTLGYDLMWRPTSAGYADGGSISADYTHLSSTPPYVGGSTLVSSGVYHQGTSTLDGLGRVIHSTDSSAGSTVDTTYDSLGRVSCSSNPYSGSMPACGQTGFLGDSYTYDALNRVTQVKHADNNTASVSYSGACATSTDAQSKARKVCADGLGRTTSVNEDPSGLNYSTTYTYSVLDNLTGVNQGSQTRTYVYDMLSRLTSATTPESGTTSYTYDANGNVLTRVAPKPNQTNPSVTVTTTYYYDALNRLIQKSYSDGVTPTATYGYDQTYTWGQTISNSIGRISTQGISDGHGGFTSSELFSYDSMGRVVQNNQADVSNVKAMYYSYNLAGQLLTATYPSGRIITYGYNAAAQAVSAVDSANSINYVLGATYAPQGALTGYVNGQVSGSGGITAIDSYNNRLQPLTVYAATSQWLDLTLTYGYADASGHNNGNVMSVTHNADSSRTQLFTYDALNRLATAQTQSTSGPNCWGQSFGYDRYANLTTITSTQCSAPALSVSVNGNNQITNTGFVYDAAGNMTNDGLYSYTYDAEGHQITAAGVTYSYDAEGRRVKKSSGTIYWYGGGREALFETDLAGNNPTEYIFFAGQRRARRDPTGTVYYYFADALGTGRVMTNSGGGSVYNADFYPFGGERVLYNYVDIKYKFTGMERDSDTGDDHTMFRQYQWNVGRWLSPDPLGGDVSNPQSLNRYAYVLNNPTSLVDPLGLYIVQYGNCFFNKTDFFVNGEPQGSTLEFLYCGTDPNSSGPSGIAGQFGSGGGGGGSGTGPGSTSGTATSSTKAAAVQAATQACQEHGQLAFNIPFTKTPVTISLSFTFFGNFSTTNDIGLTFPPSAGTSIDITVGAPEGPNIPVQVGAGKNASVGTFLTPQGPHGFNLSIPLSPPLGSPVTLSPTVWNACGLKAGGG